MDLFGRRWTPLTDDFARRSPMPSSRHVLSTNEHPVTHALRDVDDAVSNQWRRDLDIYLEQLAALTEMAPGDPAAEAALRAAVGFVSRAHNALGAQRCSCRIASWAHADTVRIYEHATRLLGAPAAVCFAPTWKPL